MIAVDTNIFLRYLMRDDSAQYRAARALLETCSLDRPAFVPRQVTAEVFWVLATGYRMPRDGLIAAPKGLLSLPVFRFEDADRVGAYLIAMIKGRGDLGDLMFLAAATDAGCEMLYTFDRRLAREPGATLLEAP